MSRRDEVLQAALQLLDDVGLDALTTRRLAQRLGVGPSALYRHFSSKRALLDAMVEHLASTAQPAPPEGEWPDQVRTAGTAVRAAMLTHRDGARLIATHVTAGPASATAYLRFVAVLRAAGFDAGTANRAVDTIVCYTTGFTIEEQSHEGPPRKDRDADFAAGLDLIITGMAAAAR